MYELVITNKNYSSWSMRPWVLMRALQIPFTERLLPFQASTRQEDFTRFSPSGRVPCLVDGALAVWDSLAIAEYLAERHAGVWPAHPAARSWARSASAEMHSGFHTLRNVCSMSVGVRVRLRHLPDALHAELSRLSALWTDGLDRHDGPWLAGARFTAVDAFFAPVASRVRTYDLPLPPRALEYVRRLLDFAPVREWVAAGIAEPWRDPAHENGILMHGDIVEDLRAAPAQ